MAFGLIVGGDAGGAIVRAEDRVIRPLGLDVPAATKIAARCLAGA